MSLVDELKMSRPFASPQHELSVALLYTAERFRDYLHDLCQRYGISLQQYNILRILRGSLPEALSCSEINTRMIQRSPDITRLLTRLEHGGYVMRARDRSDNRIVRTRILPNGTALLESMDSDIRRTYDLFAVLSDNDCHRVLDALTAIRSELGRQSAP